MNASTIRALVVEALKDKTAADERVYSPRDWPTTSDMYPALLVQTPYEEKHSLGRNAPQFTTVTTVRITGRLDAADDASNNGAALAEAGLETLRDQIEKAVINSFELGKVTQQFRQVRSTIDVSAAGEIHTGQLLMEMDIEYFQGPEDFYPVTPTPITEIRTTIRMADGTTEPVVQVLLSESSS